MIIPSNLSDVSRLLGVLFAGLRRESGEHEVEQWWYEVKREASKCLQVIDTFLDSENVPEYIQLIKSGEGLSVEFKSTLRVNLHTGSQDKAMGDAVIRTLAGFMNRDGGNLFIGVNDEGKALGLDSDKFKNHDKFVLHFENLIHNQLGSKCFKLVSTDIVEVEGESVFWVRVKRSGEAVLVNKEDFYLRTLASTRRLSTQDMMDYCKSRFEAS